MPRKKKRSDGRYEYKATIGRSFDGKPIRKSYYSNVSLADAKKKASEDRVSRELALRTGTAYRTEGETLRDWAQTWLEVYKKPEVTENTYISSYKAPVEKYLLPYFGDAHLMDIRPVDVKAFFAAHQHLSESYLKKLKVCIIGIYEAAAENGVYCVCPVRRRTKLTSTAEKTEKRVYTDDQITLVKSAAIDKKCPQVFVLLDTGLRRGELCGLMWSDVDFDNRILRIRRTVRVTHGVTSIGEPKKGSSRDLPMSAELKNILSTLPRSSAYVFPNRRGKPRDPNALGLTIKRFMDALPDEIPRLTAHELRHTYGTMLRRHGVDLHTIQKLLGHRDIEVTANTYVHAEIDTMRAEIERSTQKQKKKKCRQSVVNGKTCNKKET